MRERRCSSDGLRLFNLALTQAPPRNKIREFLHCLFSSEWDDRLEEMVAQCRVASQQLLSYSQFKDIDTNVLINNSIFNLLHAILVDEGKLLKKHKIKRNVDYFYDVVEKCYETNDHHHAIVILAALQHFSLSQFRFKRRKKDNELIQKLKIKYGTFRNCYKEHLKEAMFQTDSKNYLPCLMVLNMHYERHKAFSSIGRCKLKFEPYEIKAKIGLHAMHFPHPGEQLSIFERPEVSSNTDLILLAQNVK